MKLLKNDIVKIGQQILAEKGYECTLREVDEIIDAIDEIYVKVGEKLDVGEKANVGAIVVSKKETKERSGKSMLNGVETEWVKPAQVVVDLKAKPSFKENNARDL